MNVTRTLWSIYVFQLIGRDAGIKLRQIEFSPYISMDIQYHLYTNTINMHIPIILPNNST